MAKLKTYDIKSVVLDTDELIEFKTTNPPVFISQDDAWLDLITKFANQLNSGATTTVGELVKELKKEFVLYRKPKK